MVSYSARKNWLFLPILQWFFWQKKIQHDFKNFYPCSRIGYILNNWKIQEYVKTYQKNITKITKIWLNFLTEIVAIGNHFRTMEARCKKPHPSSWFGFQSTFFGMTLYHRSKTRVLIVHFFHFPASGWVLRGDVFEFPKEIKKEDTVPSEELVETAISYARAMEIII